MKYVNAFAASTFAFLAASIINPVDTAYAQGASCGTFAAGLLAQPAQGTASSAATATACGSTAVAGAAGSTAIGDFANATAIAATAVGNGALANAANATAVGGGGANSAFALGPNSTALGFLTTAVGTNSIAAGSTSIAVGDNSAALGFNAVAAGNSSVAVGDHAVAFQSGAVAIGPNAQTTAANQFMFGTATNTYATPGITSAASAAAQSGPLQLVTSDAGGHLATSTLAGLGLASAADISGINSQLAGINSRLNDLNTRSSKAYTGIAMAFAMAGVPTVLPNERFAVSANWGNFEGSNGLSLAGAAWVSKNVQVNGGVAFGLNERVAGARAGVRVGF
jgi:trimeric autotransporter adhesin